MYASFILQGEGVWPVVSNFLVPESFALATVHVGLVTMFLYTSNKTIVIFCSVIFYLCMNGKVLYLERWSLGGRALRMGYHIYFRL